MLPLLFSQFQTEDIEESAFSEGTDIVVKAQRSLTAQRMERTLELLIQAAAGKGLLLF